MQQPQLYAGLQQLQNMQSFGQNSLNVQDFGMHIGQPQNFNFVQQQQQVK
jgi:hypothetical protein